MRAIVIFSLILCMLPLKSSNLIAGEEVLPLQMLEGKRFIFLPWYISPDMNPDCICLSCYSLGSILSFEENGEFDISGATISECQEGYYSQTDNNIVYAYVQECSITESTKIIFFSLSITPISFIFEYIVGEYEIIFYDQNVDCIEHGRFIGFRVG